MLVTTGGLNTLRADHCHVKNKEVTVRQLLKYIIPKIGGDSGLMLSSLREFKVETAITVVRGTPAGFLSQVILSLSSSLVV